MIKVYGKDVPAFLAVKKGDFDRRACGVCVGNGFYLLVVLIAVLFIPLSTSAYTMDVSCSPHCITPGMCNQVDGSCQSKVVGEHEVYCELGWTGRDCRERCACGGNLGCSVDGDCTECAVGYANVGVCCTPCPGNTTTPEQGSFAACEYCPTNFGYAAGPSVTCTECILGETTPEGPHQSPCTL